MQERGWNLSDESMRRAANGIVKSSYFADEAGIVIIAEDSSMDWLITE
jgi:hypothetical protein